MKRFYVFLLALMFGCGGVFAQIQNVSTEPLQPAITTYNYARIYPIAVMDVGVGIGASYERLFGQKKNFGLLLPGFLILENNSNPTSISEKNKSYDAYFYFAPGFKFYPNGHKKITYAVGPSMMFGFTNSKFEVLTTSSNGDISYETVNYARKRFGVLINNYVTIQIGKLFDIGLEGGLGFCYFNKESYNGPESYAGNGSTNKGIDLSGQFSLSIGYKF